MMNLKDKFPFFFYIIIIKIGKKSSFGYRMMKNKRSFFFIKAGTKAFFLAPK